MYRAKFDERDIQPQLTYLFIIPQLSQLSLSHQGKSLWEKSQLAALLLTSEHILHPYSCQPLGSNAPMLKEFKSLSIFLTILHQRWGLCGGAHVPRGGGGGSRLRMLSCQLSQGLSSLELLQELGACGAAAFSFTDITKSFP